MDDMTPTEREALLVGLIGRSLDDHERGDVDLASAVTDVDATIDALFDVADASWVSSLRSAWSEFEIIHALMLDEDRETLTDRDRKEIDEVIRELRSELAAPHAPPAGL